ncbi:O6-methylguanine-DNA--protein-cysteine methyltransferase [Rhizobium sp. SORGH_AS 787]|nr:O6-methylguanine-DNA--protein-cysteine methyltransferase [Rhizobium sp. SORGH_AS_0787]
MRKIRYSTVSTAMGFCAFAWHDGGICRFQLPVDLEDDAKAHLLRRMPNAEHCEPGVEAKHLLEKVRAYFTGQRVEFHDTKLDIGTQSDFFSNVYEVVRAMPWGTSKNLRRNRQGIEHSAAGRSNRWTGDGKKSPTASYSVPSGSRRWR